MSTDKEMFDSILNGEVKGPALPVKLDPEDPSFKRILAASWEIQDFVKDLNMRFFELSAQVVKLGGDLEELRQIIAQVAPQALRDAAYKTQPRSFWRRIFGV